MPGMHIVVRGRVQGVGFRDYVRRKAAMHGVVGSVWNNSFGQVEVEAFHPDAKAMSGFLISLSGGPGEVEVVSSSPSCAADHATDFRIVSSRP